MRVTSLVMRHFRNYTEQAFSPARGLNVIFGDNAQGKTNLLEALFLCAFGRSHRSVRDADMIQSGEDGASVELRFADDEETDSSINIKLFTQQPKQLLIDGVKPERIGELMGCFKAVLFSPETIMLVKGSPAERRRFMDMGISQLGKIYFYKLQQYNVALRQRNALLRMPDALHDSASFDAWDKLLASAGAYIMQARARFITKITPMLEETHAVLSDERETLSVSYETGFAVDSDVLNADQAHLAGLFYDKLQSLREDDIRRGFTYAGPHKDDLNVLIDGVDAKTYASQGQKRTAALAMKLSEVKLIESVCDNKPVVLLDDVFSELDETRCAALLDSLGDCQCFITCAAESLVGTIASDDTALFRCESGVIEREDA